MRKRTKLLLALILVLCITSIIWLPIIVLAVTSPEKLEFYVKALEYGLKGLKEYFEFIINLFEKAVKS